MYPTKVQYTFWSMRAALRPSNRGWRLDYFLISKDHAEPKHAIEVIDSLIYDKQMGSDHCPIALKLQIGASEEPEEEKKGEEEGASADPEEEKKGEEEAKVAHTADEPIAKSKPQQKSAKKKRAKSTVPKAAEDYPEAKSTIYNAKGSRRGKSVRRKAPLFDTADL